jgi:hypothetical protein
MSSDNLNLHERLATMEAMVNGLLGSPSPTVDRSVIYRIEDTQSEHGKRLHEIERGISDTFRKMDKELKSRVDRQVTAANKAATNAMADAVAVIAAEERDKLKALLDNRLSELGAETSQLRAVMVDAPITASEDLAASCFHFCRG